MKTGSPVVRTVRGDIAPEELGVTAPHEHLYCDQRLCRSELDFPGTYAKMVLLNVDTIVAELVDFHAAGGRAIAEMTTSGWGRDVVVLKDISERADIHVVAISGFYVEDCHPPYVADTSIDDLAELSGARVDLRRGRYDHSHRPAQVGHQPASDRGA